MIGCLAIVNLAALSAAFWTDGWRGVGALLLAELLVSLIAGVVLMVGLSGREDRERAEVYRRWDEWARDQAEHPADRPWESPR